MREIALFIRAAGAAIMTALAGLSLGRPAALERVYFGEEWGFCAGLRRWWCSAI